jgi:hypothetical protein
MAALLKPRRLRFTLRSLFVAMTLAASWLGWTLYRANYLVERRDFAIECIRDRGGRVVEVAFFRFPGVSPKRMPWTFSRLGARPVELITLPESTCTPYDVMCAKEMFPEADVRFVPAGRTTASRGGHRAPITRPAQALNEEVDDYYEQWTSIRNSLFR